MKKSLIIAFLLGSIGIIFPLFAGDTTAAENGARPTEHLRNDMQRAIQNGHPTNLELTTIERAIIALQQARLAKEQGQTVDRTRVALALESAAKVFQSDSFQQADRQAVLRDIQELRNRHDH